MNKRTILPINPGCQNKSIKNIQISNLLLRKKFTCNLNKCKGMCCVEGDGGPPIQKEEIKKIEHVIPQILKYYGEKDKKLLTGGKWFRRSLLGKLSIVDHYSESGCIFVKKRSADGINYCLLHAQALANSLPVSTYKPRWCHLFPIIYQSFPELKLSFSEREECISKGEQSAIWNCKEALTEYFGSDFFAQLDKIISLKYSP
ncbi:DUF3109 family protein [Candidatus Riflebacteria bacterium]